LNPTQIYNSNSQTNGIFERLGQTPITKLKSKYNGYSLVHLDRLLKDGNVINEGTLKTSLFISIIN
jgi:hypothetical protein